MATLTLTIPDEVTQRVFDAFASTYGYQDLIAGEPNPQTKQQFMRQRVLTYIKEIVVTHEATSAAEAARKAAAAKAEADVTL